MGLKEVLMRGGGAPFFVAALALVVTAFVTVPLCKPLVEEGEGAEAAFMVRATQTLSQAMVAAGVPWLREYYDPARDHVVTVMLMGSLMGYVVMGALCTLLDILPQRWTSWLKVQGPKSYLSPWQWAQATGLSLFNTFVVSWLVAIPWWQVHRRGWLHGGTPLLGFHDELNLPMAVVHIVAHAFIVDFWFYITHRALHIPVFYKSIHKLHHRFKAPVSVCCMFAHPIEYTIGNVLGVILGPAITNCHPWVAAYWLCFSLVSTAGSHSGYYWAGANNHDHHHEFFDCEFGTGVFMDRLCGTRMQDMPRFAKAVEQCNARVAKLTGKEAQD